MQERPLIALEGPLPAHGDSFASSDALQAACDAGGAAVERMSLVERREINFRFHLLLAKGSHSALLVKLIEEYYDYSVTEQTLPLYDTEPGSSASESAPRDRRRAARRRWRARRASRGSSICKTSRKPSPISNAPVRGRVQLKARASASRAPLPAPLSRRHQRRRGREGASGLPCATAGSGVARDPRD